MKVDLTEKEIDMIVFGIEERMEYYEERDRWLEIDRAQRLIEKLHKAKKGRK